MPHGYPRRLASFTYTGRHHYFVTCCTFSRLPLFTSERTVDGTLEAIRVAATQQHFSIVAYCFMPDHTHLLVAGEDVSSDFRVFMSEAKQRSGYWFTHTVGGRLWQRYYWDHVVRDEAAETEIVRYIAANPVRAGLVSRVEDYAFSGWPGRAAREVAG